MSDFLFPFGKMYFKNCFSGFKQVFGFRFRFKFTSLSGRNWWSKSFILLLLVSSSLVLFFVSHSFGSYVCEDHLGANSIFSDILLMQPLNECLHFCVSFTDL